MIREEEVISIGKIFKPHGYKGEMNVDIQYGPELFDDPKTPFFVKIDNILVPFFVESIGGGSQGTSFIKFKDVDSDAAAAGFNRKELYALRSFVANLFGVTEQELQLAAEGFVGYEVVLDETGESIGMVEGVEEGVEYDYLTVKRNQDGDEINIPFIDEFVMEISDSCNKEEKGRITVSLPEGFLEI